MDALTDEAQLHVSRTEHDDGWTVAADLHPLADDEVTVELIDDTAVVAVSRAEFDIDLPDDRGTATLHNGVLVVEHSA